MLNKKRPQVVWFYLWALDEFYVFLIRTNITMSNNIASS